MTSPIKSFPLSKATLPNWVWILIAPISFLLIRMFFVGLVFDQSIAIAIGTQGSNESALPINSGWLSNIAQISYKLFGLNDLGSLAPSVVSSVLIGLLLFKINSWLFGPGSGLVAVCLWAILPLNILFSGSLLPVLPLILLQCLSISLYVFSKRREVSSKTPLAAMIIVLLVVLILDWRFAIPLILFLVIELFSQSKRWGTPKILSALLAILFLYLLVPENASAAVDVYYLARVLPENLILVPLLVLSLVYAGSLKDRPQLVVNLVLSQFLTLAFCAKWILADPLASSTGVGPFWLSALIPCILLIGWFFVKQHPERVSVIFTVLLVFLMTILLVLSPPVPNWFLTVSRISFGLAVVVFAVYLLVWGLSEKLRAATFGVLILFIVVGSFSLTNDYFTSYSFDLNDTGEILSRFTTSRSNLFVADSPLLNRVHYLTNMRGERQSSQFDDLVVLDLESNLQSPVAGDYVLMGYDYQRLIFGIVPINWVLEKEFSSTRGLTYVLFAVMP